MKIDVYVDSCGRFNKGATGIVAVSEDRLLYGGALKLPVFENIYDNESQGMHAARRIIKPFARHHELIVFTDSYRNFGSNMVFTFNESVKAKPVDRKIIYGDGEGSVTVKYATMKKFPVDDSDSDAAVRDKFARMRDGIYMWMADKLGRQALKNAALCDTVEEITARINDALSRTDKLPLGLDVAISAMPTKPRLLAQNCDWWNNWTTAKNLEKKRLDK